MVVESREAVVPNHVADLLKIFIPDDGGNRRFAYFTVSAIAQDLEVNGEFL